MNTPETKARSFRCENCGGTIKWNISKQQMECASCKTPYTIGAPNTPVLEHDYSDYAAEARTSVAFPEQTIVTCSTCGAEIAFDRDRTATVCPMCASSQVMESKQSAGVPPDGLIPFRIDEQDAQQRFRKWVTSRWFAPNKLKKAYQSGNLEGIYLPFWTFDAKASATYVGEGGTEYEVEDDKETRIEVRWTPVRGSVSGYFDDLQVCAAQGRAREYIGRILPYSTQTSTVPYDSAYLSGFSAQRYAVPVEDALETAKERIYAALRNDAEDDITRRKHFDRARVLRLDMKIHHVGYKHILLPVWVSAFSYGGKQYTYLINGETGEVTGGRPYSIPKILTAIAAVVAVILLLVSLSGCARQLPEPAAQAASCQETVILQENTIFMEER